MKKHFAKVWYYEMSGGDAEKPHRYPCGLILGDVKIAQDWGRETAEEYVKKINDSLKEFLKV